MNKIHWFIGGDTIYLFNSFEEFQKEWKERTAGITIIEDQSLVRQGITAESTYKVNIAIMDRHASYLIRTYFPDIKHTVIKFTS